MKRQLFAMLAFISFHLQAEDVFHPVLDEGIIQGITYAVTLTDFTAVLDIQTVERIPDTEDDEWVNRKVKATVIDVIYGDASLSGKTIEYIESVEADLVQDFTQDPVMTSLCRDESQWVGAGVGTFFTAAPERVVYAKQVVEKHQDHTKSRRFCE